jgi:hypothetical protein
MKIKKEVSYSLQLLIQLQKLSSRRREDGFALLMASVMSILIFSMLTIYLFSSKLSRSTANAMIDAGSTFYAAESGLNKRANEMRSKVGNFSRPVGTKPQDNALSTDPVGMHIASMMQSCINPPAASVAVPFPRGTGDFACEQSDTAYTESVITGAATRLSSGLQNSANIKYKTYSFVQDLTPAVVTLTTIPANNNFAGLKSTDYLYRVYSTALKQADGATDVSAQSMLQMQFTDRFIPIFQFAAFYQGDMEINAGPPLSISGPIHSNRSIYLAPGSLLTLNGNVSYSTNIFRSLQYSVAGNFQNQMRVLFAGGGSYPNAGINCGVPDPNSNITVPNGCINVAAAWGAGPFPIAISAADIQASNGAISKTGVLKLPATGFLSKIDANNNAGIYYSKADLRVDFDPRNATNPTFNITRMDQSTDTPTVIEKFSDRNGLIDSLQKPVMLRVTNDANKSFSERVRLCPKLDGTPGEPDPNNPDPNKQPIPPLPTGAGKLANTTYLPELNNAATLAVSLANRQLVIAALQKAVIMTPVSTMTYAQTRAVATGTLLANFRSALDNAGFSNATRDKIVTAKINEIAALNTNSLAGNGGCFLPAPMQILNNQFDKKEGRNMFILQSNIKSLTAWNRDGVYGENTVASAVLPTNNKLFDRRLTTSLASVDQLPTANNSITIAGAACDYDCLGLSSADGVRAPNVTTTTQGGMVWHFSLINRNAPYNYVSNRTDPDHKPPIVDPRNNTEGLSVYGFAFSGGARLPGALTLASDQAMYIQGDYNNPSSYPGGSPTGVIPSPDPLDNGALDPASVRTATTNPPAREKRPAAILGDNAIVLSNSCSDTSFKLNCLIPWVLPATSMPVASDTVVRAAILSGTDATVMTGTTRTEQGAGLNNHLSFREFWNGNTLKYRGSLVSKGIPTEFNGLFIPGCSGCSNAQMNNTYYFPPTRNIGFDSDFNNVDGLPPLTPNVNLLLQKVYKRDYDPLNRN